MRRFFLPFFLFFLLLAGVAEAQIQVNLRIKRRLFVRYEPIEATVSIRNLSGQDVVLTDEGVHPWFSFTILTADGRPVAPRMGTYNLEPMIIPANGVMRQKVKLNQLYPLDEFGGYRVRASIYFAPLQQYFQSKNVLVDITDGKTIWRQIVGVPGGDVAGDRREMTVMTFRQPKGNYLYAKVMDANVGTIFGNQPLGPLITGAEPQIELDGHNHLHILHLAGPKAYLHTEVGLNGEILQQETYLAGKYRPALRRSAKSGGMRVIGGLLEQGQAAAPAGSNIPKLSDRPVTIPKE